MSAQELAERIAQLPLEKRALLFKQVKESQGERTREEVAIPRLARDRRAYPLSFAQQRLWFLNQYEPDSPEYNIPLGFRIRGALDTGALRQALESIVRRHEVLRTTFAAVDGEPLQIIAAEARLELDSVDVGAQDGESRLAAALRIAGEDARQPFDLERGPLLRPTLFRLGDEDFLLYLNVHHIAWDGWSQGVFLSELKVHYATLVGVGTGLPELPIQYLDFAAWQREWLAGEVLEGQLGYWREQLAGVPALELATDRPRPALRTHEGTMYPVTVSAEVTAGLHKLSQEETATLFMTLSAALKALLHHYSGQSDFALGTLIANRTRPEIEGLIGFFSNTLVLRTSLGGKPTLRELVRREREVALGAYAHQDLPFEKLVDELDPERDLSRTPFFQAMLILHNAPGGALELPGLELASQSVDSRTAKFDLTLYAVERDGGLAGFFEYNTDLFDQATLARLAGHLGNALEAFGSDPDRRLPELGLVTGEERRQLLVEWNATRADYPRDTPLHGLFELQAAARPEATAAIYEGAELDYAELDGRANQLAHHLRALGVVDETLVGVFVERSLDMLVAVLGVLKAGGAYLPLDPEYPEERLGYMLADSGARVVLTEESLAGKLPAGDRHAVALDRDWSAVAAHARTRPEVEVRPGQLAYVIYTSGSTGRPKGVQISHRAVVNFLSSMGHRPGLAAHDSLLAVTTLSFDIAGLELFLPLARGARVEILSRETASAGEELGTRLEASAPTVMQATPATWRLLIEAGWPGSPEMKVLCGGEALPPSLAAELQPRCKELWNVYGPTEATIWSTLELIRRPQGPVSIGRPLDNTEIYVVDANLSPVPLGVPGELLIGGAGLARGYLGRPSLTAEKLIPHPFSEEADERLYRTGDLARYRLDGSLECLGRLDTQVKVRGYRIELGEIEAVLTAAAEVTEAVAVVREDRPGDRKLVAYFVVAGDTAPEVDDLRTALKSRLPEYMVPALFVALDGLPRLPNGKIDRKALPAPDPAAMAAEYVAPRTPAEHTLAEIWGSILGLERVGIEDDFFKLGGDSLLAVRVVARAKKTGLDITTKQVFLHRVLRELAAAAGTVEIVAEQGPVTGTLPMTPAQYHFLGVDHDHSNYHSLGYLLEPKEPVRTEVVAAAVHKIIEHHDSLRARMIPAAEPGGAPRLVIDEPGEVANAVTHFDFSALPEDVRLEQDGPVARQLGRSFDFARGALFKAVIFDFGPDRPRTVFLVGQFMAADIGSYQVILEDFDYLCQKLGKGEAAPLPKKTTSAVQWVNRLTERAASEEMKEDLDYFLDEAALAAPPIAVDFDKGPNTYRSARIIPVGFNREESAVLRQELPRALGVQIDTVLLTSFLYGFEVMTGERSLLVSLLGHGREALYDDMDLTRTAGWFNTIFPAFLDLGAAADPLAALPRVNRQLRAIPHGGIGYGIARYLAEDPELREKLRARPEAQVFLNYFGPDTFEMSLFKKLEFFKGYLLDPGARRLSPMSVAGYVEEGELLLKWEYSTHLFRDSTVEPIVRRAEETLRWFLDHGLAKKKAPWTDLPARK